MWKNPIGGKVIEATVQVENQWDRLMHCISTTGQTQPLLSDMFIAFCLTQEFKGWIETVTEI